MHELIDIGLNLTHDAFDADRARVIARAELAGVRRFLVTGATLVSSARALELARAAPGKMYATAGVHPHHAAELDESTVEALRLLHRAPEIVAVGECGLDFFRNLSPREAQEAAFAQQLELAAECGKPVFLHQRDAHSAFLEILRPRLPALPGGVAHCFTGGVSELEAYLELGLYIGITGWLCDERRGGALRDALPRVPLDRLLFETDAPYLLPRDLEHAPASRRNEPCYLPHIVERAADITGRPLEALAAASVANAERLFRLPA